jgi:TRAP-type C4-dicarboxylate transport system substrate-binding protein
MIGEVTPNQIFAKLPPNEQAALLERQANIMNEMKQKIKETEEFIKYHAESTAGCSSSEQTVVQNDKSEEDEPVYEEENAQSDSRQLQLTR